MDIKINSLSDFQKSALQEMGNIGSGHAAIALSQLICRKIMVAVTRVRLASLSEFIEELGSKDALVVGVYLKVLGEAQGSILLVFLREDALNLVDVLMNQKIGATKMLGEIEESALKETGSILSGTYLNALSELMKMSLIPTVPKIAFDRSQAAIETLFGGLDKELNVILGIETEFIEATTRIKGQFLFMPDETGIAALLRALGVETTKIPHT